MFGCLVTATDTGVGKTVLSAALAAAARARGLDVAAFKPVLTGTLEEAGGWPPDDRLLASVTGQTPEEVCPLRFGPAVSPHLAAEMAGRSIDPAALLAAAGRTGERRDALIVEGVGGLLVPLANDYSVRDFARDLGLPVVIAARPGLGTINHTLLTVEAARHADLDVRAVVLTPWGPGDERLADSNRQTIARLAGLEVATLAEVSGPEAGLLATAGAALGGARWMGPGAPA